jgi:hypothetical protein
MERFRGIEGQASSEYVALIALVATALVLAAGLTSGGVGPRVLAGMQRALCAVAVRDCPRPTPVEADLPPCPLQRSSRIELLSGTLGVVKLGAGGTLSAVRTSDGRVAVTLADDTIAGGELGAGVRLRLGGDPLGGTARAGLVASWTAGRSWTLPDAAAAHAFVVRYGSKATVGGRVVDELRSRCSLLCDALGWRPHPQLPPPDATYEEGGTLATLSAQLGPGGPALADGDASTTELLGRRIARDGTTTSYVRLADDARLGLGYEPATLDLELGGTTVASYTVDPAGRPTTFVLHRTRAIGVGGALAARAAGTPPAAPAGAPPGAAARPSLRAAASEGALPGAAARPSLRAAASASVARVEETDTTLDLRDPANRAAARGALLALSGREPLRARLEHLAALAYRVDGHGEIDRRVYALDRSATGAGAIAALGLELGAGFDRTREGMRLLDAETRLPGLPFLPRDDCRRA